MAKTYPITITYLEMKAPPLQPVSVPAEQIAIIRAYTPPIHFYRYLYNTIGAGHIWVNRRRLDDEALAKIVHDPDVRIYVLHYEGCPAGYAELDFRKTGEAELAYFGLMPDYTGRGLGRFFLNQAIHTAWAENIDRLIVQTCTQDHPAALPLYQRMGFTPYAQSDDVLEAIDD